MDNIHVGKQGIKWVTDNQVSNGNKVEINNLNPIVEINVNAISAIAGKLNEVIQDTCAQYKINNNKELNDAIIQLQSALRSINKFNN